ncbi:MAG: tetratricopeptide (TPR) repeat protein [Cyclobacteriaceae bacterium]|jgi:tetratricopeptide (TPR) repeat protein
MIVRLLILVISITFIFPATAQRRKKDKKVAVQELPLTGDRAIQAETTFIEAEKQLILENYPKAYELFLKTEELNPTNAAVKFKLAEVLLKNGQNEEALRNINSAVLFDPNNKYYYLFQAEIHKAQNNYAAAAKSYENLIENVSSTDEYWLELALIYKYIEKYDNALNAFSKAEQSLGISEQLLREKQQIYLRQNDMESLKSDWEKLIESTPDQPDLILKYCTILMANDLEEEAKPLLKQFQLAYPENDNIYLLLSEIERQGGDYRKALALLKVPAGSSTVQLSSKIKIINSYLPFVQTQEMRSDLVDIVGNMVMAHPSAFEAMGFAGDVFLGLDSSMVALSHYRKAISLSASSYAVWQNIVNLEYQLEQFDSLAFHADRAIEYFPNQAIFYFYSGIGNYLTQDLRKSKRALEQGVDFAKEPSLKSLFYAQLGDVNNSLKDHAASDNAYNQSLAIQPDNDHVLNNYAYFLSLRKENLDKALEMSSRLVLNNPDDATFLDTHGWVLFVKGDYVAAQVFLKKAAELKLDGTIIEHYGDVLFKLGQVEDAIEQWKKAKELGEHTDQIDQKISDKQFYE